MHLHKYCSIPCQFSVCWPVLLHELQSWVDCGGEDVEIDGSLQPGVGKLTNNQSWENQPNLVEEINKRLGREIQEPEWRKAIKL